MAHHMRWLGIHRHDTIGMADFTAVGQRATALDQAFQLGAVAVHDETQCRIFGR